ncbi:DUF899 family protein [Nocardia sp. SYP-A9097]|uniref:DUF899 family protein n=1 Tax=Nocardia sp. SYP-A9097 TaxID=2663237 RepID=UPI0018911979|nr:DUF899 family protein [Nocardia sp. SYP-A9097]
MSLAQVASRAEWLIGREEVLAQDRAAARARDADEARRQRLPMIKLDKGYEFEGPGGRSTLLDLFVGLRRLLVCHLLLDPAGARECASCSAAAEEVSSDLLNRLRDRETSFVAVSHAPLTVIERYQARRGWAFPWYSCIGSDFNCDFHGTRDDSATSNNHRSGAPRQVGTQPGQRVFEREGARLFHAYSMFARRSEPLGSWCYWLDLTARGG